MRMNRDSWLVKLAYLFSEEVPAETSICPLFWRIVFSPVFAAVFAVFWAGAKILAPLAWAGVGLDWVWRRLPRLARLAVGALLAAPVLAFFASLAIDEWRAFFMFIGFMAVFFPSVTGILLLLDHVQQQRKPKRKKGEPRESVIVAYFKAKKQRFCPRVEFV